MKTLLDELAERRATALVAASFRDDRVAREDLEKVAAGKGGKAVGLVSRFKRLFQPSAEKVLVQESRGARVAALEQLLGKVPRGQSKMKKWLKGGPQYSSVQEPEVRQQVVQTAKGRQRIVQLQGNKVRHLKRENEAVKTLKDIDDIEKSLIAPEGVSKVKAVMTGAGVIGIGLGAKSLYDQLLLRRNLAAIEKDPMIPASLRPRAREVFGVLKRYAPSLAKDPTVSRDFARNLVRHDAIDHATVKDLIHAEKEVQDSVKGKAQLITQGTSFVSGMGG